MAFINEYISEEDIEKYQINELMNSYQGEGEFPDKYYKHLWTIRQRARELVYVGRYAS